MSNRISCTVKITGDHHRLPDEDGKSETNKNEADFRTAIFKAWGYRVGDQTKTVVDGDIAYVKLMIQSKKQTDSKAEVFESCRQAWCSSLRKFGYPFWLEAVEDVEEIFKYKMKQFTQQFQPNVFSLGSFYDRETYISHWSSAQEISDSGTVGVEFEHRSQIFTVAVSCPGNKFRIEFEYMQLENYIVVDENTTKGYIHLYFPFQWPPKIEELNGKLSKRVTKMLGCSRAVLGGSSVLCLRFPLAGDRAGPTTRKALYQLFTRLVSTMNFTIYFAAIETKNPRSLPKTPTFSDFQVGYALECLLSRGFKVQDRMTQEFYDILQKGVSVMSSERICKALHHLASHVETNRFCPLEETLQSLLFGSMEKLTSAEFELPEHCVYVPRLIVTPTRNYLVPPELTVMNRVIRDFGHLYAIRVAFRDERFSKLLSNCHKYLSHVLDERVIKLLTTGIDYCGRHFDFLACSNSQLRDHGAWLYANDGEHTAAKIRDSLGELDMIRCVATYVSRMGQCFSSTKESVKVSINEGCVVEEIPDIQREYENVHFSCCSSLRSGTYTFSDGVGKISSALANKVARSLGLVPVPSAFQVRYGGCKGMLAVDPSLPHGDTEEILQYRKSMKKFDSTHVALGICEATQPNVLYLNRQCIILLSGLGVEDQAFIGLQDTMLRDLASMLLYDTVAVETLRRTNIAGGLKVSALSHSGVNVTSEPFMRSMLLALYNSHLEDLRRKSRIAIPESRGRLMLGVMDETHTLEYGQIFVRYSKLVNKPGKDMQTLLGSVMVSKNPCFHGGDMRKFKAVDVEALHHLVDCIVFPAKGRRPHPDEMSGSDLDGDKYFVTWHEKLVCERENEPPMDFMPAAKKLLDRPVEVNDMIQFVADYIENDKLGVIAKAHLVHADIQEKGIFSEQCVQLAHMHSDAVDFPKTGEFPTFPAELRPMEYPDFMMKTGKPQKKSNKVLGKLFRKCQDLYNSQRFNPETEVLMVDEDLIVPGCEDFSENAKQALDKYNCKLMALMSLYGLKNEGEVITGCLGQVDARLSGKTDEKSKVAQIVQTAVSSLRENARRDFYNDFGGEEEVCRDFRRTKQYPEKILRKASAWYVGTYERARESRGRSHGTGNEVTLLSFPWVADRILVYLKKTKQDERDQLGVSDEHTLKFTNKRVAYQVTHFFNDKLNTLVDDFKATEAERDQLSEALISKAGNRALGLSLCGSSLTSIHKLDKTTPLDVYVHQKWNATEREQLKFLPNLSDPTGVWHRRWELQTIPRCLVLEKTVPLKQQCHISADSSLMLKTAYVSLHVQLCPSLLHLLLIIAQWRRMRNLVGKHFGLDSLAVLFLLFCEKKGFICKVSQNKLYSHAERLLGLQLTRQQAPATPIWQDSVLIPGKPGDYGGFKDDVNPAFALMKFFEHYSTNPSPDGEELDIVHVKKPVAFNQEGRLFPDLSEEEIQRFSDAALQVFHEIAQCRGLDILLIAADAELEEVQETLVLPRNTWGAVTFAEEYVGSKLSELTGAQVDVIPPGKTSSGYHIEVFGNKSTLTKVRNELQKFEETCQSYIGTKVHVVTGAPRFIFGSQTNSDAAVIYKPLPKRNWTVCLENPCISGSEDQAKFLTAFDEQMSLFQRECLPCLHGGDQLRFRVKFGGMRVISSKEDGKSVGHVEQLLQESADPQNKPEYNNKAFRQSKNGFWHTFKPLPLSSDRWKSALDELGYKHKSTEEVYILQAEEGGSNFRLVFNSQMEFEKLEIPPIRWLQADVKTPCLAESKSNDANFRLIVSSPRELDSETTEKLLESPLYQKYVRGKVLRKTESGLKLDESLVSTTQSIRRETIHVYHIPEFSYVEFYAHEATTIKYNTPNSCAPVTESISFVQLSASLDEEHYKYAKTVARDIWSAAKQLLPYLDF